LAHRLKVERRAFKQLQKLPQAHRKAVTETILALEGNPFPLGKKWKHLEGTSGSVLLRVGDYRVLYEVLDDEIRALVVIHRRDLARWLRRL
jgi:mRNA interferase RelE/StbE